MKQNTTASHFSRILSRKGKREYSARSGVSLSRSALVILLLAIFGLGLVLSSGKIPLVDASLQIKGEGRISESAMRQIQSLLEEKESRTPAQQKMDSQLVYALKQSRGVAITNAVQTLRTRVVIDTNGKTVVDISVKDAKLAQKITAKKLQDMGMEVINAVGGNIRARVTMGSLETIAAFPEVRFVQPPQDFKTSRAGNQGGTGFAATGVGSLPSMRPGFAERAARVRAQLLAALPGIQKQATPPKATPPKGAPPKGNPPAQTNALDTSEGDVTHKADVGRASFGADGTGVRIGVLSDGVTSLAAAQATGDLPAVTVLPGQTGSGDEGTAMLEIVHDLAPGAELFFATVLPSITQFATNIRALHTAGCDVIIDDVIFFVETPFQDGAPGVTNTNGGAVVQAVVDVTTAAVDPAMYFSSAGNEGNLNDTTASVWEGDFVDGGTLALTPGGTVHTYGGGSQNNQLLQGGSRPLLFWSDPLGGSGNDYDLFVLNSAGTLVEIGSTNIQNGDDDPVEDVGPSFLNERLVILKKTGAAARFLHLTAFGAEMNFVTNGTTHGHNHAPLAFSCAATPAAEAFCDAPAGPFPNPHNSTNLVECFSSDGPRRIFFNANSSPITPGNVSSTGGLLRQKPDVTAADGMDVTGVGGFPDPFYGTSAAAPHAGAIAALVKSSVPGITNAQVRTALISTAIDIEAAGTDRDSGAGIIMAFEAMQAAGAEPQAVIVSAGATIVEESCTPPNGALDPNETVTVSFCVENIGAAPTVNLVGTLQPTGGVTSPSGPQNYGVVSPSDKGPTCRNFTFTVDAVCGSTVTATIQFQDGATNLGNVTYTFTVGTAITAFTENFDGVVAPALPAGWAATQGANVTGAAPWVTSTTGPDTAPNDAFSPGPNNILDNRLDTPIINITTATARLSFRNNFTFNDTGGGFDGGVLEISINAGAFTDIITAGGSFVQNGYNDTISVNFGSPIAGRDAWSGTAGGYLTTIVNLPATAAGQPIRLRWRSASDDSVVSTGWRIDTISIVDGFLCSTDCGGGEACVLTCPANVTQSNDPNQCGAVVTYNAPTTTGDCGTVTCNPPSGSFFPVGTTTVTCTATGGGNRDTNGAGDSTCTFTVTVNDTQPPTITCPANVTGVTPTITDPCAVVNFTTTASDNCPGVTVVCNPPSGSCFPVGVTTVTCTATDASGNTATCSFTVSVFNGRFQDDSAGCNNTVLINTITGAYRWCCNGTIFTGVGTIKKQGNNFTLTHNAPDRKIVFNISAGSFPPSAQGSIQSPPGTNRCTLQDRDTRNDTCICGASSFNCKQVR